MPLLKSPGISVRIAVHRFHFSVDCGAIIAIIRGLSRNGVRICQSIQIVSALNVDHPPIRASVSAQIVGPQ
jgi:hypothetical protein